MWLYDPCTNVLKEMTLLEIAEINGTSESSVSRMAKGGRKARNINCYVFKEKPSLVVRRRLYNEEVHQGEVWKRYENTCYEASNFGRVRKNYKTTTAILLPYKKKKYMIVKLEEGGKRVEKRLRDIIADTFLKKEARKGCVVHKNGDFTNCSVWNIERMNRTEVARRTGGKSKSQAVVLVNEQTMEVVEWWESARKAAPEVFMSYQAVNDRCNGRVQSRKEGYFMWESDYEEMFVGELVY